MNIVYDEEYNHSICTMKDQLCNENRKELLFITLLFRKENSQMERSCENVLL